MAPAQSSTSMHAGSFSPPRPPSPSDDRHTPGSDGIESQEDPGVWKRRYLALKETANSDRSSSKRKTRNTTSSCRLGRGIRKVAFICGDIKSLIFDADKHCAYLQDPEDPLLTEEFEGQNEDEIDDIKRGWERSHMAAREIDRIIPNFNKAISEKPTEELDKFYAELERGADSARSDDLGRIRELVAYQLNETYRPDVLLVPDCRMNRGIEHDITGRLLCPAEFDWDNLVVRCKLRARDEDFDWLSSYHSRCFYAKFTPDPEQLETGYLKSTLLIQVYKSIFTSPSSAKEAVEEDNENLPPAKSQRSSTGRKPVRRNVASKVLLNDKVTPRTIAYAAVQLHFNLQTAYSWAQCYGGFDYKGLHDYVVDFFEDTPGPIAKQRAKDLLDWWTRKIFPNAASRRQPNTSASRKTFKQQRAARERQEAA